MGKVELRKYLLEYGALNHYTVEKTIQVSEEALEYLVAPESDEIHYYEWVYLGNRYEQIRVLCN
ncbi:hypothetical protein [Tenacibaculum sp. 190524A02b]|uniref:hypothetical protein n=1 Tax=Tenacibaculum vairaonense TaxID=3137860 RepID=UPI0031FB74DF